MTAIYKDNYIKHKQIYKDKSYKTFYRGNLLPFYFNYYSKIVL